MLPVGDHAPVAASYSSASARAPESLFKPPVASTVPFVRSVAVCPSRGCAISPAEDQSLVEGSYISVETSTRRCLSSPTTTRSWFLSNAIASEPTLFIGNSSSSGVCLPVGGLYISSEARIANRSSTPLAISTLPSARSTAARKRGDRAALPSRSDEMVTVSYTSAVSRTLNGSSAPPVNSDRPSPNTAAA